MKKLITFALILVASICFMGEPQAFTYDELTDYNNNSLGKPFFITKENEITIPDGIEDYTLYYQYQNMSKKDFNKLEELKKQGDDLTKSWKEYQNTEPDYLSEEYKAKYEEYKAEYDTIASEYASLIPEYNDAKWKKATKNNVPGEEHNYFALWLKLETDDTTMYKWAIYYNNSLEENVNNEQITEKPKTTKKTKSTNTKPQSNNEYQTVKTSNNPSTGFKENILYVVILLIMIGSTLALKRKVK